MDLFDCSDSEDENARVDKKLKLPGTRHTDLSERSVKPSIRVNKMEFSPTGDVMFEIIAIRNGF